MVELAYARPMCALSVRADIDGRDSLDGYRNRSRYYQGIAHEVPILCGVAADGEVRSGSFFDGFIRDCRQVDVRFCP